MEPDHPEQPVTRAVEPVELLPDHVEVTARSQRVSVDRSTST